MKRLFNIKMPEILREYIAEQAKAQYTTMTQIIINLIIKDKDERDRSHENIKSTH